MSGYCLDWLIFGLCDLRPFHDANFSSVDFSQQYLNEMKYFFFFTLFAESVHCNKYAYIYVYYQTSKNKTWCMLYTIGRSTEKLALYTNKSGTGSDGQYRTTRNKSWPVGREIWLSGREIWLSAGRFGSLL
jgi:hypothetical protein